MKLKINRFEKKQAIENVKLGYSKFMGIVLNQPSIKDFVITNQNKKKRRK